MTAKRLEIFVIVTIIGVVGIIYAFTQQPAIPAAPIEMAQTKVADPAPQTFHLPPQQAPATTIEYPGVDGQTALALLEANHQVESKHYDFGDLVSSIDGIAPGAGHFWALYVNGNFSQVGASDYITKSTDVIRWQIDAVAN
jgi:hypothetical protein